MRNGLLVLPGSHLSDEFTYHVTNLGGKSKPQILNPPLQEELLLLSPTLGSYIYFTMSFFMEVLTI
jgi:hypothetical protein